MKTGTSLVPVSEDKIRNYESLDCVRAAIQRGELTENDLFTTVCNVQAICDDLAHELYRVISYIPANTNSTDNKLLNHCDIAGIGGNTDVQVGSCVNHASDGLVDITTSVQSLITTETTNKVSCSDYETCCANWDLCISCLKSCPGLDCTGSDKVSCSDYESCCSNWNNCISCLKACAGLDCTGTLVASDLDTINTCIACLNACPGLDCAGDVTKTEVNAMFTLIGTTLTITSVV